MKPRQDLGQITTNIVNGIKPILQAYKPDIVLVHGDTTTTFATSLAAFYEQIEVGHVEAGLRTDNLYSPWPEEGNRKLTSAMTQFHFAPTESAQQNLLKEGINKKAITATGNTVIDALFWVKQKIETDLALQKQLAHQFNFLDKTKKLILVTGHRRESFGAGFEQICEGIQTIANKHQDVEIVYPVHLNPQVQEPVNRLMMYLARKGHMLYPNYLYCSQVPTAREQVNLIGANIKRITIGNTQKCRDPRGLDAMQQLKGLDILDYS
jgi:UDP-N-acetylglucosamine 2-epimerase (non-hydrolysing)